ncbi:MAG TPA: hypothetical protein VG938_04255 [Verrucomicrobiae bacterium]|jgi:hypothetical protein|nr:hypothetical protein [Verrucomicrobiae bacterium]
MNAEQETDFQTWAKLLIHRKVPDDYQHLINEEVIHEGEIILRRGDAFEIHFRSQAPGKSDDQPATAKMRDTQILLTPLPRLQRPAKILNR